MISRYLPFVNAFTLCDSLYTDNWNIAHDPDRCVETSNPIRPFVICLPAWWRFWQCIRRYRDSKEAFPHLVNAAKYSTTFVVVLFGWLNGYFADPDGGGHSLLFYAWILSSVVSSLYAYTWDIKMDWGLLDKNAGDNRSDHAC